MHLDNHPRFRRNPNLAANPLRELINTGFQSLSHDDKLKRHDLDPSRRGKPNLNRRQFATSDSQVSLQDHHRTKL